MEGEQHEIEDKKDDNMVGKDAYIMVFRDYAELHVNSGE